MLERVAVSELGRLRWHCRRGMKELDVLLERWMERDGPRASGDTLGCFAALLELPDPELARLLLSGGTHADPATDALLARIRQPG